MVTHDYIVKNDKNYSIILISFLEQGTGIFSQMVDETSDDNFMCLLNGDSTLQNRKSFNN